MFTIQNLEPSGDTFLLWWEGETIAACEGPLYDRHAAAFIASPDDAYEARLRWDPEELAGLNVAAWGSPRMTYRRED